MPFMWADTLLSAERALILRLMVWGAASVLVGTALFAWLRTRGRPSSLLEQFAMQTAAWGTAEVAYGAVTRIGLGPRDISGATRLDRLLWLTIGLDIGFVLVGLTLSVTAWRLGPRLSLVGAGTAVVVQGTALLLLDLLLASQISR